MKVSLRRKIHIMALPQETFLNARWSEDQSAAIPCQPERLAKSSATSLAAVSAMSHLHLRKCAAGPARVQCASNVLRAPRRKYFPGCQKCEHSDESAEADKRLGFKDGAYGFVRHHSLLGAPGVGEVKNRASALRVCSGKY